MKKIISAILFLVVSVASYANPLDDQCPQFVTPHAPIVLLKEQVVYKCMKRYGVAYDTTAKIPLYVVTKVTVDELNGTIKRGNNFYVDDTITTAKMLDYAGTKYDKGHLAEAELFTTDQESMDQSFWMGNMHPQWYNLNRGIWHALENHSHKLAQQYGTVYIISGTVYNKLSHVIGDGATVPEYSFKVIEIPSTNTVEAYMIPNSNHTNEVFMKYKVTEHEIEVAAGIKF